MKENDKQQHLQLNYSPEVIYIKFIDGSIIDVEEIKRMLKKYGEVKVISRKIEGRSYFILFKEEVINNIFLFLFLFACLFNSKQI